MNEIACCYNNPDCKICGKDLHEVENLKVLWNNIPDCKVVGEIKEFGEFMKNKDSILKVINDTASGLHNICLLKDYKMEEFDELCSDEDEDIPFKTSIVNIEEAIKMYNSGEAVALRPLSMIDDEYPLYGWLVIDHEGDFMYEFETAMEDDHFLLTADHILEQWEVRHLED